jgi:hypothetical protein
VGEERYAQLLSNIGQSVVQLIIVLGLVRWSLATIRKPSLPEEGVVLPLVTRCLSPVEPVVQGECR